MDKEIRIVYVDDSPDSAISEFLDEFSYSDDYTFVHKDVVFCPNDGYESLLENGDVTTANVLIIDSRLFENKNATNGKFTGEEFKLVLKKFYPFIETIVITQNEPDFDVQMVAKYNSSKQTVSSIEYYTQVLSPCINSSIENLKIYRKLADEIEKNDSWEKLLRDRVLATINGTNTYDKLTKSDLDIIVDAFKTIQEKLDG